MLLPLHMGIAEVMPAITAHQATLTNQIKAVQLDMDPFLAYQHSTEGQPCGGCRGGAHNSYTHIEN